MRPTQLRHWPRQSTTPILDITERTFRVTHPFHPLRGRQFDLVNYTLCWGEPRAYFHDDADRLCSLPAAWTSVGSPDPTVEMGAGRSPFRADDLLDLAELIRDLNEL